MFQPCECAGKTDSALALKYTHTAVIRTIQKQIKTGRRKVPNPQKDLVDVQQMRYGTTDYVMKLREILNSCFATQFYKMKRHPAGKIVQAHLLPKRAELRLQGL